MPEQTNTGKIEYSSTKEFSDSDILSMLKDLPDACCIYKVLTDPFGTVKDMLFLFANEKYAQLVGKPTSELIGNTYLKSVSNRDEDWIKYSYQAAMLRQSSILRTYNTYYDKWFEFWAVPVYQKGFCAFIIHDVTATKHSEDDNALTNNTNKLVIECAKALSSAEFGKGLRRVLKVVGEAIEADRVYAIETEKGNLVGFHEWINGACSAKLPTKEDIEKYDFISLWDRQLKDKDLVFVNDTMILRDDEETLYNEVLAGNIQRYSVAVLRDNEKVIGYLVADNYPNDLTIDISSVIESVAIFISYEMRNRTLTAEMTYLGSHDALTGVGNRYALNQTLKLLTEMSVTVGVCYLDVNGLKAINKEKGHEAGDAHIKTVAERFAQIFKKKYCYRIGGDEFIAVIPEIKEGKFNELVDKYRKKCSNTEGSMGSCWIANSQEINHAIKEADEAMREDKSRYYAEHERRKGTSQE